MKSNEKKATIKASGKTVTVYKHSERGTWVNSADLETEYIPEELKF